MNLYFHFLFFFAICSYKDEENDNILLASREEHFREAKVKHWEQAEKTNLMRDVS